MPGDEVFEGLSAGLRACRSRWNCMYWNAGLVPQDRTSTCLDSCHDPRSPIKTRDLRAANFEQQLHSSLKNKDIITKTSNVSSLVGSQLDMIIRHTCARLARSRRSQQLPVDRLFPFARARRCQGLNPIGRCYATENTTQYAPEDTSFPSFDPPIPVTLQRALAETRDDPKVSHEVETYLNRNRIRPSSSSTSSSMRT